MPCRDLPGRGIVAAFAIVLFVLAPVGRAAIAGDGATIRVPDDVTSIQAAIDAASDGDVILVASPPPPATRYDEAIDL